MSTFTPKPLTPYKKAPPPDEQKSHRVWNDFQFRGVEKSISLSNTAVEQLQEEMALIWAALNALGQTRP